MVRVRSSCMYPLSPLYIYPLDALIVHVLPPCQSKTSAFALTSSSPAGQTWACVVTTSGLLFILWHTWHFDRWRCFTFSKKEWFKPTITWMILSSVMIFTVWAWMEAYVMYEEVSPVPSR